MDPGGVIQEPLDLLFADGLGTVAFVVEPGHDPGLFEPLQASGQGTGVEAVLADEETVLE